MRVPFFSSIQTKILMTYLVFIVIILALLNIYPPIASRNLIFASKQSAMNTQTSLVTTSVEALGNPTSESVTRVMSMLDVSGYSRIIIVNADSELLFRASADDAPFDTARMDAALADALDGYDYFSSLFRDGAFMSVSASPILLQGKVSGAVFLYEYDAAQGAMILSLRSTLRSFSLAISAAAILLSIALSRSLAGRITRVLNGIQSVREGEYSYRIQPKGRDELALLAEEFNSLTDRLQKTDEVRRQFVADASHELKTPLASIRLLSDSIVQNAGMDQDTINEFVRDIGSESERLGRITEKLLSLTKFDSQTEQPRAPVDICAVSESVLRILRPLARQRSITVETDYNDGCIVYANADDVSQIILNLAENAIKYNVDGGHVRISVYHDSEHVMLAVEDTGIGVPKEDLPNIFNRFYRVDKARSRAAGGSGLGLSIVMAAAKEYGGIVEALRRNEGGMCFAVTLPLYTGDAPAAEEEALF